MQEDDTTHSTTPASPLAPTASQHSNTTTGHINNNSSTNYTESLRLLSSQLQQLPQQQLINLLLQAISLSHRIHYQIPILHPDQQSYGTTSLNQSKTINFLKHLVISLHQSNHLQPSWSHVCKTVLHTFLL